MDEGFSAFSLQTARQVLQNEFPAGFSPESAEDLARFRRALDEAASENDVAFFFSDESLVSLARAALDGAPTQTSLFDLELLPDETRDPASDESETPGELLDRLFQDGHAIVFYSVLFKRRPEVFERAGVESHRVKSTLREERPQYYYETLYATPTKPSLAELEVIRNQLLLKWGDSRGVASLSELASRVFIPVVSIRDALEAFPGVFTFGDDEGVGLNAELTKRADQIFDEIVDEHKAAMFDVVFYSSLYNRNSEVFALHGIASATELRKAILERGLDVKDFGEYMTFLFAESIPKDALILNALRAAGLLLAFGWRTERMERLQARKSARSFSQKVAALRRDRNPPKIKVDRLFKSGRFFIPEDETVRILKAHPEYFRAEPAGEWSLLSRDGKPTACWTEDELKVELDSFLDESKALLGEGASGEGEESEAAKEPEDLEETADDAEDQGETTGDSDWNQTRLFSLESESNAAEREGDGDASEEVGRFVDDLFRESRVVLYYRVLFERHEEFFRRLGIESPQEIRVALKKSRPNFDVQTLYVAPEEVRGVEAIELTRREIERLWGDNSSTTATKLAETLYATKIDIQKTLESYPSRFRRVERDAFMLEPPSNDESKSSRSPFRFKGLNNRLRTEFQEWYDSRANARLRPAKSVANAKAPRASDESDASETLEQAASSSSEPASDAPTARVPSPKREKPRIPAAPPAPPAPPKLPPRERLREIVEELARSGQLVLYYHTLLERNAELSDEYGDKTALRAALVELFPSFGYADSYFEPRRRSPNETEEAKIRRSLILCWGDAQQQRLDALAPRFCAPATLLERTLKNSPDDFADRGRQRFAIKDKARDEAARLRGYSAKLLDDLKSALAPDGSYLFYESYYAANAEWLAEMGIDSVPLLRRELANLNKDAALGYVFYRNHCERQGGALGENDFIRRLIQTRFGGETRLRVGRLAEDLRIPATLIRDALAASGDYVFEGGDRYRRGS